MDMRRPMNEASGASESPVVSAVRGSGSNTGSLNRLLVIVLILAGLAFLVAYGARGLGAVRADSSIKSKEYQALFLTNGQVYFGKLTHVDSGYVKLTDIYYLQVQQTVQPSSGSSSSSSNNQQVSLAKLGGELHGPEDTMYVSRQQVLFWENLKTDGKVTQAIQNYKNSGNK